MSICCVRLQHALNTISFSAKKKKNNYGKTLGIELKKMIVYVQTVLVIMTLLTQNRGVGSE